MRFRAGSVYAISNRAWTHAPVQAELKPFRSAPLERDREHLEDTGRLVSLTGADEALDHTHVVAVYVRQTRLLVCLGKKVTMLGQ